MTAYLTVRKVPRDVQRALKDVQRNSGDSLNQTVITLLRKALGLGVEVHDNGLGSLAGTWGQAELRAFERSTKAFEAIDDELWT